MPRCQHSEGILLLWMWDICSGSGIKCRQHLSHCFTAKDLPTQLFPFLKDSFNSEKTVNVFLPPQVFLKPTSHLVLSFSSNACVPFSPIVRLLPRPKPYTTGVGFFSPDCLHGVRPTKIPSTFSSKVTKRLSSYLFWNRVNLTRLEDMR